MKNLRLTYVLISLIAALAMGCAKEEPMVNSVDPDVIKILPFPNVAGLEAVVAGDGVVLIVFFDANFKRQFVLIDNEGEVIWQKHIELSGTCHPLHEPGNNFVLFSSGRMTRINHQGEIIYDNTEFPSLSAMARVISLPDGGYLLMGTGYLSGNRCQVRKVSQTGEELFNKFYAINIQGLQAFTGAYVLEDGNYLLAGSFNSNTPGIGDHLIVSLLDPTGEFIWTNIHELNEFDVTNISSQFQLSGRDLIKVSDDEFLYVIGPKSSQSSEQSTRIFRLNSNGELLPEVQYLDFGEINAAPGPYAAFRTLERNSDGSFTGVINSDFEGAQTPYYLLPVNYTSPQYAYFYELDAQGRLRNMDHVDRNYSNYLHSVARLSNGKSMLVGSLLSLGLELRIMVIIRP